MIQGSTKHVRLFIILALVLVTLCVHWPIARNDFINFDDPMYVTENARVMSGITWANIAWAFTTTETGNWHPLTWLSHMADCHVFGMGPQGHHFTSLFLHILNVTLLFGMLKWMTGQIWPSVLVAALFALHPLHVETVAWVSERKELLSTFFWITTIWSYGYYVRTEKRAVYYLALFCFLLGLMSKPMIVTLPFVLLLLDLWPLNRMNPMAQQWRHANAGGDRVHSKIVIFVRLLKEKAPFFLLAGLLSAITYLVQQQEGSVKSFSMFPWDVRVVNAIHSYMGYLVKMLWPKGLAVYYPHSGMDIPLWQIIASGTALGTLSIFVLSAWKRLPFLLVGWLWYLGTLIPVIGLVQIGSHAMTDRYTYLPLLGIFIAIAWGLREIVTKWQFARPPVVTSCLLALIACSVLTFKQLERWYDSVTLFQHSINVTTDNWLGHNNLGLALAQRNDPEKVLYHYEESIRINPHYANSRNNIGIALVEQGRTKEAIVRFKEAIAIKSDYVDARYNLANALVKDNKLNEAIFHYRKTLKMTPQDGEIYNNLGIALMRQGRYQEAVTQFEQSLRVNPDNVHATHNLAVAHRIRRDSL